MSAVAYVNGRYRPASDASIVPLDRGYQFADAVYEVWGVHNGALLDAKGHFERLHRSLAALEIPPPMSNRALLVLLQETARRNRVRNGIIYLQISRGVARRDHAFPNPAPTPSIVITATRLDPVERTKRAENGVAVITRPDLRWARCDIKSTALLANVLAKEEARRAGATEAWLVDADGFITEGASTNAWIVDAAGMVRTRPLSTRILPGVTRAVLLEAASRLGLTVEERAFTVEEALASREAFLSSATQAATGVVAINGQMIGEGRPGPLTQALRQAYFDGASGHSTPRDRGSVALSGGERL